MFDLISFDLMYVQQMQYFSADPVSAPPQNLPPPPLTVNPGPRFIVKNCLLPAIPSTELADQFAFHPTGSTTAAIVHTLHHVTSMLEDNSYVRCILVDFSKAFDTINHQILFSKLQKLSLQPAIFSWLVNFLTGQTQAVCLNGNVSDFLDINQSIIQGLA